MSATALEVSRITKVACVHPSGECGKDAWQGECKCVRGTCTGDRRDRKLEFVRSCCLPDGMLIDSVETASCGQVAGQDSAFLSSGYDGILSDLMLMSWW